MFCAIMRKREAVAPGAKRRGRPPIVAVPATGTRVVKKYGNRRLYDARDSRYINLEELVDLFAAEEDVRVLDAVSGEDLTDKTLRQAVLSEEGKRRGVALVPADLLKALLRYRKGPVRGDFERHLSRAVASFSERR
jgi:polyhydroxyalkanoate synthesis repressor PhaR